MPAGWAGEAGCVYSLVYWDGAGAGYLLKGVAMDTVLVISSTSTTRTRCPTRASHPQTLSSFRAPPHKLVMQMHLSAKLVMS